MLWAGGAQAQSCSGLFEAIKREAMYCGFFCDQRALQPLQRNYEASCVKVLIPSSPFDLDSVPQDVASLGRRTATAGDPSDIR